MVSRMDKIFLVPTQERGNEVKQLLIALNNQINLINLTNQSSDSGLRIEAACIFYLA